MILVVVVNNRFLRGWFDERTLFPVPRSALR